MKQRIIRWLKIAVMAYLHICFALIAYGITMGLPPHLASRFIIACIMIYCVIVIVLPVKLTIEVN